MNRYIKWLLILCLIAGSIYGSGRLYFRLTGGFTEANIVFNKPYDQHLQTKELNEFEKKELALILSQPFYWLGKGCQSYVFGSADGRYVIKFIKYQRFRNADWTHAFTFIPYIDQCLQKKTEQKRFRLNELLKSWKLAYEHLPDESGVLYVHLNPTQEQFHPLLIYDKLGFAHKIDLDKTEFLLQKRAEMLCPVLERLEVPQAKQLIDRLFALVLNEYHRGYADNDHALMQNTGVSDGKPLHIDAGQLIKNKCMQDPAIYKQELYNKMFVFREWLQKRSPELAEHLEMNLRQAIGDDYAHMKPYVYIGNVAKIPHED